MSKPPQYFEQIRAAASRRWDQLEHDRDLAGPWHQLFKQVQSPRHVVSELLQNADDAAADEACVVIQGDEFVFTHNGHDFERKDFESLCRFGYSHKRSLHTIGFRGIGFKSTFSLGDEVRLFSPTLSVVFRRQRFTEPVWIDDPRTRTGETEIHVTIKDGHRRAELEKNLAQWLESPASLLFFRNLRRLRVGRKEVRWTAQGEGPVTGSSWMVLSTAPKDRFLLVCSAAEPFPEDALEEILEERMVAPEGSTDFPPCRVEVVLGMEGRLFVVLPTGVKTELPFACNAPFVQDPARVKVKDPETSATNRWLLSRAGALVAQVMLDWLKRADLSLEQRCEAYALFPDVARDDQSLEGTCGAMVEEVFEAAIKEKPFLLTQQGRLMPWQGCLAVPEAVLDVWSTEQVAACFSDKDHAVLSRAITPDARQRLIHWGCVGELQKSSVLAVLKSSHLPKPDTWRQLLTLWAYVSSEINAYYDPYNYKSVRIVPVQGKEVLHAASEVARLGEGKLLQSQEDWEFLAQHLPILNYNWPRFLSEQRRKVSGPEDEGLGGDVGAAFGVLEALELDHASDVSQVIQLVATSLFSQKGVRLKDCIRLAQVAATLGAEVSDDFEFVTRDRSLVAASHRVLADLDSDLDGFVTSDWYDEHALHEDYSKAPSSCTPNEWQAWISCGRSGLLTFVPLAQAEERIWGRQELLERLRERGMQGHPAFPYKRNEFVIVDWDFEEEHWEHWRSVAAQDPSFWGRLLTRILHQPESYWSDATTAKALQVATTGSRRAITYEPLVPTWILKLRTLQCLQDTWGQYREPADVLRRTPETESLLDVEPFVRAELDTESSRPLLTLLGVRDTPTGPDRLLERILALSRAANPPVEEVKKWYRRLDRMAATCTTEQLELVRETFGTHKIILTEDSGWGLTGEVFLASDDEDVPGAAVVHSSVRNLALWRRIGVADRPTVELAVQWLKSLGSGQVLSQDEVRRVRSLLQRHSARIWDACGHWLNLEGQWAPVGSLAYALTMQSLVHWKHLFPAIKQKTADFQQLSAETCDEPPFSEVPCLADSIEERFDEPPADTPDAERKTWLIALGSGLLRIILDDEEETRRVRELARCLVRTRWRATTGLETAPYIGGAPAGTARRVEVLWKDAVLYVENRSAAKIAKAVAMELGRAFRRQEIIDAIKLCYDRSPEFVAEYLEENVALIAPRDVDAGEPETVEREIVGGHEAPGLKAHESDLPQESEATLESPAEREHHTREESGVTFGAPDGDDGGEPVATRSRHLRETRASLIERFARVNGYIPDGADRFYHTDGSWIEKVHESSFPWELHSAAGDVLQRYWVKDHCIQREPLQLDADVWALCDKAPDTHSLILSAPDGAPVQFSGRTLREMSGRGQLTLFPATYRLAYGHATKS